MNNDMGNRGHLVVKRDRLYHLIFACERPNKRRHEGLPAFAASLGVRSVRRSPGFPVLLEVNASPKAYQNFTIS